MMGQGASSQPQLCRPPDLIKVSHADGCGRPVASSGCRPHLCTPELQPEQLPQPLCASASPGLFILNPQGRED